MPAPRILHQDDVLAQVDDRLALKAVVKPTTPPARVAAPAAAAGATPTKAEYDVLVAAVNQLRTVLTANGLLGA